jgi:hypothetical protein
MIDFQLDDFTIEELKEKFEQMKKSPEQDTEEEKREFNLSRVMEQEIRNILQKEMVQTGWGEDIHYWFVDYDADLMEVYATDICDGLLYGFAYTLDGDSVIIDWASKKRKKFAIVDFDEAEVPEEEPVNMFVSVCGKFEEALYEQNSAWEAKYKELESEEEGVCEELFQLREFKARMEDCKKRAEQEEIFAQFADLADDEPFMELKKNASEYATDVLEEKCYALRGRKQSLKFSVQEQKSPKLMVERSFSDEDGEPYGGIFKKFNIE